MLEDQNIVVWKNTIKRIVRVKKLTSLCRACDKLTQIAGDSLRFNLLSKIYL